MAAIAKSSSPAIDAPNFPFNLLQHSPAKGGASRHLMQSGILSLVGYKSIDWPRVSFESCQSGRLCVECAQQMVVVDYV
ncbi:Uncharacterised protein [Halioglobus japonicus]|nr:Uncharacterised protein [Halioglobus japonicus]